jgi:hypothetical protein
MEVSSRKANTTVTERMIDRKTVNRKVSIGLYVDCVIFITVVPLRNQIAR